MRFSCVIHIALLSLVPSVAAHADTYELFNVNGSAVNQGFVEAYNTQVLVDLTTGTALPSFAGSGPYQLSSAPNPKPFALTFDTGSLVGYTGSPFTTELEYTLGVETLVSGFITPSAEVVRAFDVTAYAQPNASGIANPTPLTGLIVLDTTKGVPLLNTTHFTFESSDINGLGLNFLPPTTTLVDYTGGAISLRYLPDSTLFLGTATEETPAAVTPEPNSLLLLGTGLFGAVGIARRRISMRTVSPAAPRDPSA